MKRRRGLQVKMTATYVAVTAGAVLIAEVVIIGAAALTFGLLSTRRLIRRLKRLAAATVEVADGGFERRIPVSGADEVSQLEENFNRMAGRLQASLDAERQLVEANARHQERSRIARELHDSISQELFSLSVLAGGLRRALPPGSGVLTEVETMERTAGDTMLLDLFMPRMDGIAVLTAMREEKDDCCSPGPDVLPG